MTATTIAVRLAARPGADTVRNGQNAAAPLA